MPINASLASDQYARFAYMRDNGHLDFVLKADKCDQFFVGNQWLEADLYALRAQRRPALTINKIISTIGTILGEQIYNRTEVLFRPQNGSPSEVAEAARSLGMTEWRIFWRIHLPNALPGIIAGGLLAFARGLGEFGATAMIAGNIAGRTRTLPLAVYSAVAAGDWEAAGWYVAVIVGICLLVVIGLNVYLYKTKQQQGE